MRCWGQGAQGVLGTDSDNPETDISALGYIPFSDTSEILGLSQGGYAQHVIFFFQLPRCEVSSSSFHLLINLCSGLCLIHIIEGKVLGLRLFWTVGSRINIRLWLNIDLIHSDSSLHPYPDICHFTIKCPVDEWS